MGERRIIWLVRRWLIDVFWKRWYRLFFSIISPSRDMHLIVCTMPWNVSLPLRLYRIRTFAMFWCLESYYMIITDILWCDLHLNTPATDHVASIMLSNCVCLFPCSIWNARHAWTLPLTPHSIMILHQREREPMTSAHWACKHGICPVICHLHNCLVTQVLSATRNVKISRNL